MGKDIELVILFADVVGSTRLYEVMGDLKARDTVARCIEVMREATEEHNGTVIKTMGDEVMSTFPTPDDALDAGTKMQQQINNDAALLVNGPPVHIRIGCHFGPVVLENRDVFGSAVHTANRMTSQAKADQIITTSVTVDRLSSRWQANVRKIDVATVRGRSEEVALFEVLWQPGDETSMLPNLVLPTGKHKIVNRLTLTCQNQEVVVTDSKTNATIGRAEDNDLIIKGNLISRLHVRIEMNRGKFLLIDQSTNGSFVQTNQGEEHFVRRDSMQLLGEGIIGLGKGVEPGSRQAIHYVCEDLS